ncbi:Hydroxyproline-rich glycoprotein family protein [Dorcoceras hygrometricum]|uniref:Hydroxyproline-rich glycoprotein family protein n=1 Tax=Dorcoceras hygrometricum TaxID=472368 RepID=A0A2Z7CZI8_9LAMI|nr:Hydroxyproline-rich glycoprotein family protein [Dorcoceras hygrometricum]
MASYKFLCLLILISVSFSGMERASAARRLQNGPFFPGYNPTFPFPSIPTFGTPGLFSPLVPSPYTDPTTPSLPNFPQFPPTTTFPGVPNNPIVPDTPTFPTPETTTTP